ncbi:MAG: type II CRISPR RNA-guided endonuclease Cas9 [Proteobacteria bacterium ST_bin14]|nr:MAG: type II CRISPR RNA-guided endonuclease Cas9 [Proteobacteria bacterium ST_bin14]
MRILGIDGGIASTGWAMVDISETEADGRVVAAGSRTFESPEEPSQTGPKLKNADRRMYRGQRRVVRRRAQRMAQIRQLLHQAGLLEDQKRSALEGKGADPWLLRAEGLDRCLTPREFALALGHIAIHRGFRSNSKRDRAANAADDNSKMLSAIHATQERLAHWRTVGEMFARDPEFAQRRRNRSGDFTRSIMRSDQEAEVRKLFEQQRCLGNKAASYDLMASFADIAFSQRPLGSSEDKVGDCIFEPTEKRTARFAPSFERFRLLSRLINLRLQSGRVERALNPGELALCIEGFGKTKGISFKAIRNRLDLDANTRFAGVAKHDEKHDVAARTGSAAAGTAAFIKALQTVGEIEARTLLSECSKLDRAAEIITFNEDTSAIKAGLAGTGLSSEAQDAIVKAIDAGDFDHFKGAAHISAKAARNIIPGLMQGLVYSEACEAVGYDHSARAAMSIDDIGSPVARKALSEMLKQVKVLAHEFGPFDRIHIEMARDVGKSIEERGKIERGIEKRTSEKDRLRLEMQQLLPHLTRISGEDLLRFELWKEQNGRCLYTDQAISPAIVVASDNNVQVDHILPWSRFGDDSFINKTLCFTSANAEKRGDTPYEWFMRTKPDEWDRFAAQVEACKTLKGRKKRNYLMRNAEERESQFRERNLNDTRYATRILLGELKRHYFPDAPHHVAARPGELTAKLRQAWGIEKLKKDKETGKRLPDDRHHALDAIVVAVVNERLLQWSTKASQQAERTGAKFELHGLPEPWPNFREEVTALHEKVFVSRAEVRRARGKAHDAGIKQLRTIEEEEKVFERKAVEKLTLKDLDLIPVPEPYGKVADPQKLRDAMVETLRAWILATKNKQKGEIIPPPRSSKGDIIRKVRVMTNAKPAVMVRGGTADRGGIVRVDVFTKPNKRGAAEFFLVPVYVHEAATLPEPPNRAVQAYAAEADWPVMTTDFTFKFSLYAMSLVEVYKKDGEVTKGYFRGIHRTTGAINISDVSNSSLTTDGIGARTLMEFKKLSVDRLGRVSEIVSETRTWRGEVFISPNPDG